MYDEVTGKKTPNETISFLKYYFDNILSKDVKKLYLFSDNCGAQNKNYTLVQFLFSVVKSQRFEMIVHRFPEPGHSFLPCDRSFGVIEKQLRKIERIYSPTEYKKIYARSSNLFSVIDVTQDMIRNYVEYMKPHFKKSVVNKERQKFLISKYKVIIYEANNNQIQCSEACSAPIYNAFQILSNQQFTINPALIQPLYQGNIPLMKKSTTM